ncbi:outer membrane beta-barrel protein [Hymenobacter gummosus]|uniref:outer membrane beta-barrel protein n=1 Tax=Hymenobacter gummosus TaxID=1776032 RepID=UPI0014048AD5|nr:outer membrane beta-barrel protein [Hymenobacter gummosus]
MLSSSRLSVFSPATAVLAAVLGLAAAPASRAQQLQGGVRAGGNISSGVGADARNSSLLLGYHGGLTGRLAFTQRWSVHPEALYTLKGDRTLAYGPSVQARLGYLEMLLLPRFTLDEAFVEAGPYAAVLLHHHYHDAALQLPGITPFRRVDYGLALGIGYQDPGGLSLSWRYVAGVNNLYRPVDFSGVIEQVRMRNGTLQFTFGYLLPWTLGSVK